MPIASVLRRHHQVEIVGPALSGEIYMPFRDAYAFKVKRFDAGWWETHVRRRVLTIPKVFRHVYSAATGDVLIAFKPRLCSFGAALWTKCRRRVPLVLDMDDWDAEGYYSAAAWQKARKLLELGDPCNIHYDRLMERLSVKAEETTVVSAFLQRRFGGVLLPTGPDCNLFDPARHNRADLRRAMGMDGKFVILFTGKADTHKGLEFLAKAIDRLRDADIRLLIVGPRTDTVGRIQETHAGFVLHVAPRPHSEMPQYLAASDLVVFPQRNTAFAQAQVPAKLYEAMAMAKPIVATAVSDIPEILEGTGTVVPPDDIAAMGDAIRAIRRDAGSAMDRGLLARRRCMTCYGWDAMDKILQGVLRRFS